MNALEIEVRPENHQRALELLRFPAFDPSDPPRRPRRRAAPRRKPFPRNRYVFHGNHNFRESQRCKVGSIIFPDPAEGWSPLCVLLVEKTCAFVLELQGQYPVRQWGGVAPSLARTDFLIAASEILDVDDSITTSQIMAALAEAYRWVGYTD